MKRVLIVFLFLTSISCSALENVIFGEYSFPMNNNWQTMRLLENGEGFAVKGHKGETLIVNQVDDTDSLVTLENGNSVSIVKIHLAQIQNENINSKSKILHNIYDSFPTVKKVNFNGSIYFVEESPEITNTQVAYVIPSSGNTLISIITSMQEHELLNFLKSIKVK